MATKHQQNRAKTAATVASSYRKGASVRAIARKTGKSYGTVHNMLQEKRVKMRSRGGPNHHGKKG
jgi:transposase